MKRKTLLASASLILLSACGGDEAAPVNQPPTQAPATISYTEFAALQGAQSFLSSCAVLNVSDSPDAPDALGVFSFGEASGLTFDLSNDQETWTITGDTLDLEFGPADLRDSGDDDVILFQRQIASGFIQMFALTKPDLDDGVGDDDAEFLRIAGLQVERSDDQVNNYTCVIGVPIDASDTLPASSFSYDDLEGFGVLYRTETDDSVTEFIIDETDAEVEIDRTQGRLRLSLDLEGEFSPNNQGNGDDEEFGSFSADIPFNGNPRDFTGPLLDENGVEVGEFSGVFFGPEGSEIGVVFSADSNDEDGNPISFVGAVIEDRDDD